MQLAHAAPRCASRRLAAMAAAMASAVMSATLTFSGVHAAALPTTPAPTDTQVDDATDGTGAACTGQPAYKAVIVVGPTSMNTQFKGWADAIASSAKDAGMSVCKVYTPYADADTVKVAAKGADLFVTLMHGNGYPHSTSTGKASGAEPNDGNDDTAHGLGLNASHGSTSLKYYGANWVSKYLKLAPDAVVILSHMCNTAGNSEDSDPIPTYALAIDHVDNFAQGFLAAGSYPSGGHPSAVMALQDQSFDKTDPKGTLIHTLMSGTTKTLDQVFMTKYTRNTGSAWKDAYLPNFGAIGTTDFYVTTRSDGSALRSPGRVHLDPDLATTTRTAPASWDRNAPDTAWLDYYAGKSKGISNPAGSGLVRFGYVRSIVGDLGLKASTWKAGASTGSAPAPTPTPKPTPDPTPTPDLVDVPDIRGESVGDATSALLAAEFKVGDQTEAYSDSVATGDVIDTSPSSRDGDHAATYQRGKTLDLKVSKGPQPPAELTSFKAAQGSDTTPAATEDLPVFTPNGDGASDTLKLSYNASRAASIKVSVTDAAGAKVRSFSVTGVKGPSSFTWNGKSDAGKVVPDGRYTVSARISGGNTRSVDVKSLTAIKVPVTSRTLLNASDQDSLARTAKQSVAVRMTTTITWVIRDSAGDTVRTGIDHRKVPAGTTTWTWDGKDDAGAYVPNGSYTSAVSATTSKGTYSLHTTVRVMPYRVTGDFDQRPGQWNTFAIYAAENQKGTPVLTVKQPGMTSYKLTLKKVTTNRWSAIWKARSGSKGTVTFTVSGTDANGGKDTRSWKGSIQ